MVDPTEQSPEQQLPFHVDVNTLSAGALAYVSWQFSELYTQYSQYDETDSSQLLTARSKDEAHAATWLRSFGLTWLQGTRLLIESHKVERRIASEAARKVGETVLTEIVERHRLRSDDHD